MNVILNPSINIALSSAFLVQESDGVGTLQFQILGQPVTLSFTSSSYIYDTIFSVDDRVRLIQAFGSFGLNSSGILKEIIIDPTEDKGRVLFDIIFPDHQFHECNVVNVESMVISVEYIVPLSYLEIV